MHGIETIKAMNAEAGKRQRKAKQFDQLGAAYRLMEKAHFDYSMAQNDDTIGQGAVDRISAASNRWQEKSKEFSELCEKFFAQDETING